MNPWALVFRRLAQAVLPSDAFFEVIREQDGRVVLQISWLMPEEVAGAAVRCEPIRLIVGAPSVKEYAAANPAERLQADQRFQAWLEGQLKNHPPKPAQVLGVPRQEWIVEQAILFPAPK